MIPIHCISLASKTERRDFMAEQFARLNLSHQFFDAIQIDLAAGWPTCYDRQRRLAYTGVDMRAGEMGCFLSHRQVWLNFLQTNDPLCLVVEDDVLLSADFPVVVEALCKQPQRWDFVRLFAFFPRQTFGTQIITGKYRLIDYLQQPNGTQGYLLNRKAAAILLAHTETMWHAIDNAIDREWEHGLWLKGVKPNVLSHQEEFETTLGVGHKARLSWRRKLARESFRFGSNLRKQFWLLNKRLRLLSGNTIR
jgi:glycosyl transferase family 25